MLVPSRTCSQQPFAENPLSLGYQVGTDLILDLRGLSLLGTTHYGLKKCIIKINFTCFFFLFKWDSWKIVNFTRSCH